MYKDKEKQRTAGAERQRRYREKGKALHPAIKAGIERITMLPDGSVNEQERVRRVACATTYQRLYPEQPYKGAGQVLPHPQPISVTRPGDAGYKPLCQFTEAWMDANNYDYE